MEVKWRCVGLTRWGWMGGELGEVRVAAYGGWRGWVRRVRVIFIDLFARKDPLILIESVSSRKRVVTGSSNESYIMNLPSPFTHDKYVYTISTE